MADTPEFLPHESDLQIKGHAPGLEPLAPVGGQADGFGVDGLRAAAPGQPSLAIFDDHLRSFPLPEGTIVVGRSRDNHLRLHDQLLSRKHCSLTRSGSRITLADLNSSNGTYLNGERVGTVELKTDDIVELGKTVLVIYDGRSWSRGDGLLNLRNPVKAQELVQRLREDGGGSFRAAPPSSGPPRNGVRNSKGLEPREKAFLRWLEAGGSELLPDLVSDYLTHKLVSLLVRNSRPVRAAFTTVLEEMLRPEFFQRIHDLPSLRSAVVALVQAELDDLGEEPAVVEARDRDLLEPDPSVDPGGDPTVEPSAESSTASSTGNGARSAPVPPSRPPEPGE